VQASVGKGMRTVCSHEGKRTENFAPGLTPRTSEHSTRSFPASVGWGSAPGGASNLEAADWEVAGAA
jgi:hypothetical protein